VSNDDHRDGGGSRQIDRRFEAVVLVTDSTEDSTEWLRTSATVLDALRGQGFAVAVITPSPLAELAALLLTETADTAPLLLAGGGGAERAIAEEDGLRELPRVRAQGDPTVLERVGRGVADRLAVLGFTTQSDPIDPAGFVTMNLDGFEATADEGAQPSELLALAVDAAHDAGLADPHATLAGTRLTIGTSEERGAVRWALDELWNRGYAPADILVVDSAIDVPDRLADQLRRRGGRELPGAQPVPGWSLVIDGFDPERERARSALLALADGRLGTSGAPLGEHANIHPYVLAMGVYDGSGPETHLLTAPVILRLPYRLDPDVELRRALDLRTGVLHERLVVTRKNAIGTKTLVGSLDSVRFSSLARPGTVVVRASCPDERPRPLLFPPADDDPLDEGTDATARWMRVSATDGGVAAASIEVETPRDGGRVVDRVAVYELGPDSLPEPVEAVEGAQACRRLGFDRLLAEHRRSWAGRWQDADITIEGDDELQLATRFNLFHLMASVPDDGEAAVGARGLTGPGYRGHVFWDADTFVLPFLAATHPPAARAMLEYRIRRLPAALDAARALQRAGARFPWESARSGRDVTPLSAPDRSGRVVPIRTGLLEEHIVAQVPWAACCYTDWTGDDDFAYGAGLRLVVESARYWASRIRVARDGTAHIYGVIGPDEYHEPVDDNAFTNVAARWNLRRAADAVEETSDAGDVTEEEAQHWRRLADELVDGYDADTGIYEQFAGFRGLEPLIIEEVAPRRPIAADLLLGAERVHGAQVIKQADVLMLHHLFPAEVAPDSLEPNLRHYEPRTAHGSSLSPAIHASLFARVRDFDPALAALRMAARIDLDDLTGTTGGGLHLATMGGVWQAFAYGFFGLRPHEGRLIVDPRLPPQWAALEIRVRFRGSRMTIRSERGRLTVHAAPAIGVLIDSSPFRATPGGLEFERRGPNWRLIR
jgi:trehalose/maltose hydrolase-like predicted phosphorylase